MSQQNRTDYRRSDKDRIFAGVAGGLADLLAIDALIIRLAFVALLVAAPPLTIVLYLTVWALAPDESGNRMFGKESEPKNQVMDEQGAVVIDAATPPQWHLIIGIGLVVIGAVTFLDGVLEVSSELILASLLIVAGIVLIFRGVKP